jgi:hypothetical protein
MAVDASVADEFVALYQKVNTDGTLDDFFHQPQVFGISSNDFAAVMLMLDKLADGLPDSVAAQVRAASAVCRQAVETDVEALSDRRPEWALIRALVAALAECG